MTDKQKKKLAIEVAAKIDSVMETVGSFTEEELKMLEESKGGVVSERSVYTGLGSMFDQGDIGARTDLYDQAIERVEHILGLRDCLNRAMKSQIKYAKTKQDRSEMLDKLGLT